MVEARPMRAGEPELRLRALDGLRYVAAMAVALFHFTGRDSPAWGGSVREVFPFLSGFTVYGGYGPYLFFMISGFVVLMSAWGRSVPAFIASRVGRLYPAYWVAVLLIAAVVYVERDLFAVWGDLGAPGVALNLTMFQSAFGVGHVDGVFWTLWVELKFYLLLGVMVLVGITRERMLLLCLLWPVAGVLAVQADARLLVTLLEPNFAPFFCIGILLYLALREAWSVTVGLLLAANASYALWISTTFYVDWSLAIAGAGVSVRAMSLLLVLCIGAVVVCTMSPVARLDWRWLSVLGALTYPLYLLHEVPGWTLIHHLEGALPAYGVLAIALCAVTGAAWLVHRLVERPLGPVLRRAVERDLDRSARQPVRPADESAQTPLERQSRVRSSRT
ncbi:acyltransferase family protein [Blastococcus xanthinilyticus]|uniref:Peptidoglycan/LPS O-acetylase OafA/YrhL n=1 Tax=Blastococcus xanthinilyticus TaxID=1564164 RepID=A0A5S5D243_9ACTN|nr:acyltransferase [Blastococcus xanthinilyticus]TYP89835.1 peptidoglycan/LPS O-acetylase OafA/YrhL [Blastococcus xanthinilyticus]